MKTFLVDVARTGHGFRQLIVEAKNAKEAKKNALRVAANFEFRENSAEYDVGGVKEFKLP